MSNVYQQYQPPAGDGDGYLKLADGDEVRIRIASEPYLFNSIFKDKETGEETVSTKYAWIVFNKDADIAQVLQLPVTTYRAIAKLAADADWGNPRTYDIKLSREGMGTKTRYYASPNPNKDPLTSDQKEAIGKIEIEKMVQGAIPLAQFVQEEADMPKSGTIDLKKPKDVVIEDLKDDAPVNLDEIPF